MASSISSDDYPDQGTVIERLPSRRRGRGHTSLPYTIIHAELSDRIREIINSDRTTTSVSTCGISVPSSFCLAHVGPSSVCNGSGVFASRFLPAGSYVTAYPGRTVRQGRCGKRHRTRAMNSGTDAYIYEFDDGTLLDGQQVAASRRWWCSHGVANLLNDAIHPEVTGRIYNCEFVETAVPVAPSISSVERTTARRCSKKVDRVYIRTNSDVQEGEELLVSYSLDYWLYRRDQVIVSDDDRTRRLSAWLACHKQVERMLTVSCRMTCTLLHLYGYRTFEGEGVSCCETKYALTLKPRIDFDDRHCNDDDDDTPCACVRTIYDSSSPLYWTVLMTKKSVESSSSSSSSRDLDDGFATFDVNAKCGKCGEQTCPSRRVRCSLDDPTDVTLVE